MAELIRGGKSGRIFGHLLGLLTTMKGLPLAYNKDLQEDKEGVFDTVKTIIPTLKIFTGMLKTLKVNTAKMEQATTHDLSNATEFADYLASKGLPFREAHRVVGELVLKCIAEKRNLQDLTPAEMQAVSPLIANDIYAKLTSKEAVARRNSFGGTGFSQIKKQLAQARAELASNSPKN